MSQGDPKLGVTIALGTAYATVGNVLLRVVDAGTALLLLAALSVYSYGLYTLALAAYSFWTVFFLPALQNVIVSDVSASKRDNPKQAQILFSIYAYFLCAAGIGLWALFYFGSHHYAYWVDGHGEYLIAVSWFFLLAPFETIFGIKAAILFDFGWVLAFRVIKSVARIALLGILTWFSILTVTTAIQASAAAVALAILSTLLYRRESWLTSVTLQDIKTFWRHYIASHGKWALAEDMFNSLTQSVQPFIIKYFLGAEAVALVTLASNLLSYVKSALPIRDVLFPILPQTEDRIQLGHYTGKIMKYATIVYCAVSVGAAIGAPIVTHLLIPKYAPALELFYILLFSLPFFGIRSVAVPMFYALKAQKSLFYIIVTRTTLSFVLILILTWSVGIKGAVIGMTITGIVTALSYLLEMQRRVPTLKLTIRNIFTYDDYDKQIVSSALVYIRRKLQIVGIT